MKANLDYAFQSSLFHIMRKGIREETSSSMQCQPPQTPTVHLPRKSTNSGLILLAQRNRKTPLNHLQEGTLRYFPSPQHKYPTLPSGGKLDLDLALNLILIPIPIPIPIKLLLLNRLLLHNLLLDPLLLIHYLLATLLAVITTHSTTLSLALSLTHLRRRLNILFVIDKTLRTIVAVVGERLLTLGRRGFGAGARCLGRVGGLLGGSGRGGGETGVSRDILLLPGVEAAFDGFGGTF